MVMLNEQDTRLEQTYVKEGSITRVSLEWQGREYDTAPVYTHQVTASRDLSFSVT